MVGNLDCEMKSESKVYDCWILGSLQMGIVEVGQVGGVVVLVQQLEREVLCGGQW